MINYTLGLDVWEGALNVDESEFRKAGVEILEIRLNDMNGGHHLDTNFYRQWDEAVDFVRVPYFVYNPWVSGYENWKWLRDHLPAGVTSISADIEVRYSGYAPSTYAAEVDKFRYHLRENGIYRKIYTGQWFLTYLAYWPKDEEYWWARYPKSLYPDAREFITWEQLRSRLADITWFPASSTIIPGPCNFWQCSADRYILPGTADRPIDINVFKGTVQDYIQLYNVSSTIQVPARLRGTLPTEVSDQEKLKRLWEAHPELHF